MHKSLQMTARRVAFELVLVLTEQELRGTSARCRQAETTVPPSTTDRSHINRQDVKAGKASDERLSDAQKIDFLYTR